MPGFEIVAFRSIRPTDLPKVAQRMEYIMNGHSYAKHGLSKSSDTPSGVYELLSHHTPQDSIIGHSVRERLLIVENGTIM